LVTTNRRCKPLSDKNKTAIFNQIRDEKIDLGDIGDGKFWRGEGSFFESGDNAYFNLSKILGSEKNASDFLLRAGIDGIQYPSEALRHNLI